MVKPVWQKMASTGWNIIGKTVEGLSLCFALLFCVAYAFVSFECKLIKNVMSTVENENISFITASESILLSFLICVSVSPRLWL